MPKKKNKIYCVTAINRMTRRRERVSGICSKVKASAIRDRELGMPSSKRAYIYPKGTKYSYYLDHPAVQTELKL